MRADVSSGRLKGARCYWLRSKLTVGGIDLSVDIEGSVEIG